jgi:type IV secretion system protein TrbI
MNDTASDPVQPVPPKLDPETLVLRGKPSRVIRFRRSVIIGISALGSIAIIGTTWFALRPVNFNFARSSDDTADIGKAGTPDELSGAPKTYGDIPRLGPPLPGDLGRPILAHQKQLEMATEDGAPIDDAAARAAQAEEAELQRKAAELKAAREAGVLFQTSSAQNRVDAASLPVGQGLPALPTESPNATGGSATDAGGQRGKEAFANSGAPSPINPSSLEPASSPWTLTAGSTIAASLITGLNSDLPGMVAAQVTENVRDSVTGRTILIPQGSRLIGKYDSVVAFGQSRALLIWQRLILPDGSSIMLDNAPATDDSGYAGLSDRVDFHTWRLLKGIGLSTLLGVGTQLSLGSSESDLVRAVRESAQSNADRAGQQITSRNLDIQPTITVKPGFPVRVMVHKDLILRPWAGGS